MKKVLLVLMITIFCHLGCSQNDTKNFDFENLKTTIQSRSENWGKAMRTKDISLLKDLYDQKAHYLPDGVNAIHGLDGIITYWTQSMDFIRDMELKMETLEGTKELLYETGNVLVKVPDGQSGEIELHYNYVNVWKLQADGSYKVVIDIFNNIKNE